MTALAVLSRIKALADFSCMYVVVTINAPFSDISKLPTVISLQVTGNARCGRMRSRQRKGCSSMLFQTKGTGCKSVNGMTTRTVRGHSIDGQLPFMVVSMAGSTGVVG